MWGHVDGHTEQHWVGLSATRGTGAAHGAQRLMAGWLKNAGSVMMVFVATWAAAIMYWRSSGTTPNGMQMLAYLGVLPVGLSGAGYMLRGMLSRGVDKAVAASANAEEAAPAAVESGSTHVSSVAITAGSVHLPAGDDASAVLAVASALPRPQLDTRFRDANNLPIRVSAVAGLDEWAVLSEREGTIDTAAHERRAMALLQPVLEQLLDAAYGAMPAIVGGEEVVIAGLRRREEDRVENVLTVELVVSPSWSDGLRHWAQTWLQEQALQAGLDARRFDVRISVFERSGDVWPHLQRVVDALSSGTPRWHLLASCYSAIDAAVINNWLARGLLATAQHADGHVPGEGAAGVLLASSQLAGEGAARFWRPQFERLEPVHGTRPAELRRQLASAATQWLQPLLADAARVQFVLHDSDQRPESLVDTAAVTAAINPDLDFSSQSLALALCSGELGPVLPVALLALAQAQLQRQSEAVVLLGVADAQQRLFGLVEPLPSPTLAVVMPAVS